MASEDDNRDASTIRMDLLVDQVNVLCAKFDQYIDHKPGNSQTVVTHRTEGMSPWAGAAMAACFFTFLGLILFALIVIPEIHDLKAWSDVYRGGISILEENVKVLKADKINREHK